MVITINLGFSTGDNKYSQLCIIKCPKILVNITIRKTLVDQCDHDLINQISELCTKTCIERKALLAYVTLKSMVKAPVYELKVTLFQKSSEIFI